MAFKRPGTVFRVFVGGIGVRTSEHDLYAAFARVGVQLTHVELVVNRATGCLRGFAFVAIGDDADDTMAERASASVDDILARMRLAVVDDRLLTVRHIARELTPRARHGPTAAG